MTVQEPQAKPKTRLYRAVAQVIRIEQITPRMRRITLGGEGLKSMVGSTFTADAIKLYLPEPGKAAFMPKIIMFPTPGNRFKVRAYTIRRFDAAALELDIDIVLHGDSPASMWARTVQVGDQIGFIGPRHEYSGIKADQCLLAGDETALPAIAAILEELPAHVRASVILEVDDQADEIPLQTAAQVDVRWLHRGSSGRHDLLDEAVRSFPFPAGKVYVWVAGESHVMRNIRRFLLEERRIDKADMHISGYWS